MRNTYPMFEVAFLFFSAKVIGEELIVFLW
jgi:hypothetical protein